jgi:hypothetical protein
LEFPLVGGPRRPEIERVREASGHSLANPSRAEDALAFAIAQASAAGQWVVVAQLAEELKARRLGRG